MFKKLFKRQTQEVNWLSSMRKLKLKDGDIVVISLNSVLSEPNLEKLKSSIEEIIRVFGYNVHVMILEEGAKIGVLTSRQKV